MGVSHLTAKTAYFTEVAPGGPPLQELKKEIPKRTATRDLTGLVEKNILKKIGEKKGTYYILSPKVIEKIRDIKGHR